MDGALEGTDEGLPLGWLEGSLVGTLLIVGLALGWLEGSFVGALLMVGQLLG